MPASLRIHRHVLRARSTERSAALPEAVSAGLADALRAAAPADHDGVWLINRLDVHTTVAAGTSARAMAGSLAAALVRALDRTLAEGPLDADVRWYPDRSAFLEQWLVDLRTGRASTRWEYRGFAADSAAAAIRLRANAEPEVLVQALRRLPPADLDAVLALLAPADAAAVVHALARGTGSADAGALTATAARLAAAGRLPTDARHATLLLLVTHGTALHAGDASLARDVALVLLAVRACPWHERAALLAALGTGDWAGATWLGAADAAAALAGWPPESRAAAVAALRQTEVKTDAVAAERGYTRFGGQFLLLPLLAELPLAAATAGWPVLAGTPAHRVLGALAVVGVLGTDQVLADPYLRLALGLPETTQRDLAHWLDDAGATRLATLHTALAAVLDRRADGAAADRGDPDLLIPGVPAAAATALRVPASALLRELAYRLPGMASASAAHLRRNVLASDAQVTIDEQRVVVELGPAPLNLLLSLTGMNRRTFTLEATGDRPWIVTTRR